MITLGRSRVAELKSELRKTVLRRNFLIDSAGDIDCGMTLLKQFRPEIGLCETRANELLDELSKVDPSAPKMRYNV